jgi:hypothetical protein
MRSTLKKRRRRFRRPLALAGAAIALAAPATAGAVQLDSTLPGTDNGAQAPARDQGGARLDHRGLNQAQTPYITTVHIQSAGTDGSNALEIALASSALGIALCGSGYALIRASRIRRSLRVTQ